MSPAAPLGADEFVAAFADHGRTLWLLAAAWVGRSDASDVVQETARIAWQKRDQFTAGTDLRRWLSQIARHVGSNWRRRAGPLPADEALPEPPAPPDAASPWPLQPRVHLTDELARALAQLPEVARECLLLHVVAEHTLAEIGTLLDLPANTVASHVRRARLQLRTALANPVTRENRP